MPDINRPPERWGSDPVAGFIDNARNNVFASFQKVRGLYAKIVQIDEVFRQLMDNLLNPRDLTAPFFVLKAHSSFLGAAHLSMAGQAPESFMLMRGCLEAAMYALFINRNPEAAGAWFKRHEDEAAKAACRKLFTARNVLECLNVADSSTHDLVSTLYGKTIDFGAHPNVASLITATRRTEDDERIHFQVAYLNADPEMISGGMKSTAQTGVTSLLVFKNIFPERFDLLGLSERFGSLREGL